MEGETRMAIEPFANLRVLMGGIIIEDDMDGLFGRNLSLDLVEEADELLMPMLLHAASNDLAFEHIEGGKQGRAATSAPSGATRGGRVLSRNRPSKPSRAKRSCQRQTQVLDLPVRRLISLVPTPSALNNTISARQTCFCGALRSRTSASRRRRSEGVTVMEIPVRMPQIRTQSAPQESLPGFKCQI